MKRRLFFLVAIIALLASTFAFDVRPANATVRLENAYASCSEFGVSGTWSSAGNRSIALWVVDITGGVFGTTYAFTVIAGFSSSGRYGTTIKFTAPAGRRLYYEVGEYVSNPPASPFDGFAGARALILEDCSRTTFSGPVRPANSELKTITCDVAVFDSPGGKPVGENRIKAGQTWFVVPGATADKTGENWVQVYVSGFSLGWIPAKCVPGADTSKKTVVTTVQGTGDIGFEVTQIDR
jgi:hypothetical protein